MNLNRTTYQDTEEKGRERTVQKLFEIRAIQLLLAGVYFLFGVKLTKAEKLYRREQAIVMRKSISAANRVIDTKKGNKEALSNFTNDYGPSWRARMKALSLTPCLSARRPGQRKLGPRVFIDHPDALDPSFRWDERKVGITPRLLQRAFALFGWDGNFICRAPP